MAQYIKKANIWGRVGSGIGKGLAEQVPKEIERNRLASGLKDLEGQEGLTPFQRFSRFSAIPGVTPQMIQSGSDLLRQEAQGKALSGFQGQNKQQDRFPEIPGLQPQDQKGSNVPSLTQEEPFAKAQEGYIPPSLDQEKARAAKKFNERPEFYGHDPQKALEDVRNEVTREQEIANAYKTKHENLDKIQTNVTEALKKQSENLGVQVPATVYSDIENEAIQATKPKSQGGKGLTEQQAKKEFGEKLDNASRQYADIQNLSKWNPTDLHRKLNSLQKEFAKRGDTRNLAQELINQLKISPMYAYHKAEPTSNIPGLENQLNKIKTISGDPVHALDYARKKGPEFYPDLLKSMGTNGSPLSIAYELEQKGYDPKQWLEYVSTKRDDLTGKQIDQLSKNINIINPLSDWWLKSFEGK